MAHPYTVTRPSSAVREEVKFWCLLYSNFYSVAMKPPVLLLSASLFVNAALVVAFVLKPSLAPAAVRGYFQSSAAQKADHAALLDRAKRESDAEARRNTAEATSVRSRLWSSLDS